MKYFVILLVTCYVVAATHRHKWKSPKEISRITDDTCEKLKTHFGGGNRRIKTKVLLKVFEKKNNRPTVDVFFSSIFKIFQGNFGLFSRFIPTEMRQRGFDITVVRQYVENCASSGVVEVTVSDIVDQCRPAIRDVVSDY